MHLHAYCQLWAGERKTNTGAMRRPRVGPDCAFVGFHDRPTSMSASAVILGYTLWSFAGLAAGIGLVTHGGGLAVTTGVLFLVTAVLMFLGAAGYIARNRVLTTGVFLSGVTSLGATITTALLLTAHI